MILENYRNLLTGKAHLPASGGQNLVALEGAGTEALRPNRVRKMSVISPLSVFLLGVGVLFTLDPSGHGARRSPGEEEPRLHR